MIKKITLIITVLFCSLSVMAQKKNVLFIIADDLNCYMGSYGHYAAKTPNLDKLAKNGLQFDNAFCNYPLCGPSRASMMTGLYPDQSGNYSLKNLVRDYVPDVVTMSQAFINQGYEAARVGKIYHYSNPGDIGKEGHDDPASWTHRVFPKGVDKAEEARDEIFSLKKGSYGATLSWLASEAKDEEHTDGMVATESIKLLEQYAKDDKPFFLGVGFYKPHTPFVAPKKYFDLYDKKDLKIPTTPEGYMNTLPEPVKHVLTHHAEDQNLDEETIKSAIQAYLACVSFMDAQVGRVLDALKKTGLDKNTIVVFTSDHGFHVGEHAYYHKNTLFEVCAQIPLIVSAPDMKKAKGKQTKSIVEMIDLYPTLCDWAGVSYPEYVAGKSMVKILENPKNKTRKSALTQVGNKGYTIRTKDYRYSRWKQGGEGMTEFYDRKKDPHELNNLAGDSKYQDIIKELDERLTNRISNASTPPEGLTVLVPQKKKKGKKGKKGKGKKKGKKKKHQ